MQPNKSWELLDLHNDAQHAPETNVSGYLHSKLHKLLSYSLYVMKKIYFKNYPLPSNKTKKQLKIKSKFVNLPQLQICGISGISVDSHPEIWVFHMLHPWEQAFYVHHGVHGHGRWRILQHKTTLYTERPFITVVKSSLSPADEDNYDKVNSILN